MKLVPRRNAELCEYFVQVVFNSSGADKEALAYLRVGEAVAGQICYASLLGG